MNKIHCVADIQELEQTHSFPAEQIDLLYRDLKAVYDWAVPDQEVSFEDFSTEDYDYGYIAVLDGTETTEELEQELGLTGGYTGTIPEAATNYYWGDEKWTRVLVIYNDSYSMLLWIKNYDGFDSYAEPAATEEEPSSSTLPAPF